MERYGLGFARFYSQEFSCDRLADKLKKRLTFTAVNAFRIAMFGIAGEASNDVNDRPFLNLPLFSKMLK